MSWIDSVNAAALRRLQSNAVPDQGTELIERVSEVVDLIAFVHPGLVGSNMALVAQLDDGNSMHVDDRDPTWRDLLAALDRDGRVALSATQWTLHLLADETTPIVLIGPHVQEIP